MITIGRIAGLIIILISLVRTMSYGIWTLKKRNIAGAVVIFLIAVASTIVPAYYIAFRK